MRATLLFLPGTLCDRRVWSAPLRALQGEWPCAVVDYPDAQSIADMASIALATVDGPIIPIGHSMGGIVAIEIWRQATHRVVALALFDTDPGADTAERRARREVQLRMAMNGEMREMVESQLLPAYFSPTHDDANANAFRDTAIAMAIEQGVRAFAAQANALAERVDAWELLGEIHVPALVACGADDRLCPPVNHRRMAAALQNPTLALIANAGHFAPLEQPGVTAEILRNWLKGLGETPSPTTARDIKPRPPS